MKLLYSIPKGLPYIDLGNNSKLIFSTLLEKPNSGFKYLCFSGIISKSFKNGKSQRTYIIDEHISFVTNMRFIDIPKVLRTKWGVLSPLTLGVLKKIFEKLAPDGYFPRSNLDKLCKILDRFDSCVEDTWSDDPTANGDEEDEE